MERICRTLSITRATAQWWCIVIQKKCWHIAMVNAQENWEALAWSQGSHYITALSTVNRPICSLSRKGEFSPYGNLPIVVGMQCLTFLQRGRQVFKREKNTSAKCLALDEVNMQEAFTLVNYIFSHVICKLAQSN